MRHTRLAAIARAGAASITPVVLGVMLGCMTYSACPVGNIRLIHEDGSQELLSHEVSLAVVIGLFCVAAVMLAIGVYCAIRNIQTFRSGDLTTVPAPLLPPALKRRINLVAFCVGIVVSIVGVILRLWTHK